MQKTVDAMFFKRNSQKGIDRYLSDLGFDLKLGYTLKPDAFTRFVNVVQNEAPVIVVEKIVAPKEVKPVVKKNMKMAPRSK